MMKQLACGVCALAGLAGAASAQNLLITEVYIGIDGPDGTEDWIEVTNFGSSAVDLAGYAYDDVSADINESDGLESFILEAGASVIILNSNDAEDITSFQGVWGSGADILLSNGGGGLGQGGDTAVFLAPDGSVIDMVDYSGMFAGSLGLATIEILGGVQSASVLGENNAFESNPFFNDTLGTPEEFFFVNLIGSPGAVPAPGSVALLGVAGFAASRRRR